MQIIRSFNLPALLLNLVLAAIMGATVQSGAFGYIAIAVTAFLVIVVVGASAAKFVLRRQVSSRFLVSLIGTALLWIPVYDAPGRAESPNLSWIVDCSLVLGCLLLIGSAIWPRRDAPIW